MPALIFDCDGVLADTERYGYSSYASEEPVEMETSPAALPPAGHGWRRARR